MDDRIDGYARAILDLATAEGELERVESEFLAVGQALEKSEDLRATLTDPELPVDRKHAVIDQLIGARASVLTVGLVQFMVGQGRSSEIPSIAKAFVEKAAESRDMAVAEVRSAIALDDETIARLATSLGKATGKRVEVKVIVDESVVGGIVARVGDVVIDGTVAHAMGELRQAVMNR
ncbi:MAG: ATP synthase F1 subunit delta [Actinomycetota bacterium]|nr:ATP synthase F1 subunit delta [Actinomycetota bacterium]